MNQKFSISDILSWFLMVLFVVLGIMNWLFVHPVPGIFYGVLSLAYCPPLGRWMHKKTGFMIPFWVKMVVAILILWATLAVGDLAELYGL